MSNAVDQAKREEQERLAKTILYRCPNIHGVLVDHVSIGGHVVYGNNVVRVVRNGEYSIKDGSCKCHGLTFRNGGERPDGSCNSTSRKCDIFKDGCEILTKEFEDTITGELKTKYPIQYCHFKNHISGQPPQKK
jgi:hypothetical protein